MARMAKIDCDKEQEHNAVALRAKERILLSSDVERVAKIFHLLSDPGRLKIVMALLEGDMCVYHLVGVCESTYSGVSHQLRTLKDNNIVKCKRVGQNVEYSLADMHVREIVEKGIAHLRCHAEV